MVCKRCRENPVYEFPGNKRRVCRGCFLRYFEKKALKTIRKHNMVEKGDHLGVAVSGGKDSLSVLSVLNRIAKPRKDLKLTAVGVEEGIKGFRSETLKNAKRFCKENGIEFKIYSFKGELGVVMDDIHGLDNPCAVCGVLRRSLLNSKAKKLGINKLFTGHNADDECQSILMNQFRRNVRASARLGPVTGISDIKGFVRRYKPLYFMLERECAVYAFLKGFVENPVKCPYSLDSYREEIKVMLNKFESKYPGTKSNILNSFLEILPKIKKGFGAGYVKKCSKCAEPCSGEICKACEILEKAKGQS